MTAARGIVLLVAALALAGTPWTSRASIPVAVNGWRAFPNPFVNRFRIVMPDSTTPAYPISMGVRVFDMRGHLVRHWDSDVSHEVVIDWDGRTDGGAVSASGWYIFDIRLRNWPGLVRIRFKMLRIRGAVASTYEWQWRQP